MTLDERAVFRIRDFFEVSDEDLQRLATLRPLAEKHTDQIVAMFYEKMLEDPETKVFLRDPRVVERLRATQRNYFLRLFSGVLDEDYVENRLRVGTAHQRIGLPQRLYLGAYAFYLRMLHHAFVGDFDDKVELERAYRSIERLVFFDIALAIECYMDAHLKSIDRQRAAIRELSTPVIRVHDQVLLLPIIGTVDSLRAQQIMETVLESVATEQARVIILDIAGVGVVDTQVADHLLKTTAAVRLLGAKVILTGISPQVAKTIVELGVSISSMATRNRLADGIELALSLVGKQITDGPNTFFDDFEGDEVAA